MPPRWPGLDETAADALDALAGAELLAPGEPLRFLHPLVRAADLLRHPGRPPGQRPCGGPPLCWPPTSWRPTWWRCTCCTRRGPPTAETVAILRAAAERARAQGAPSRPSTTCAGLWRSPRRAGARPSVLVELARAETGVGDTGAVRAPTEAVSLIATSARRAEILLELGWSEHHAGRFTAAAEAFERGMDTAAARDDPELAAELEAGYLVCATLVPARVADAVERIRVIETQLGRDQHARPPAAARPGAVHPHDVRRPPRGHPRSRAAHLGRRPAAASTRAPSRIRCGTSSARSAGPTPTGRRWTRSHADAGGGRRARAGARPMRRRATRGRGPTTGWGGCARLRRMPARRSRSGTGAWRPTCRRRSTGSGWPRWSSASRRAPSGAGARRAARALAGDGHDGVHRRSAGASALLRRAHGARRWPASMACGEVMSSLMIVSPGVMPWRSQRRAGAAWARASSGGARARSRRSSSWPVPAAARGDRRRADDGRACAAAGRRRSPSCGGRRGAGGARRRARARPCPGRSWGPPSAAPASAGRRDRTSRRPSSSLRASGAVVLAASAETELRAAGGRGPAGDRHRRRRR